MRKSGAGDRSTSVRRFVEFGSGTLLVKELKLDGVAKTDVDLDLAARAIDHAKQHDAHTGVVRFLANLGGTA